LKKFFTLKKLDREFSIKDANAKVKVSINKKVFLLDAFKDMWNRIKRRTLYSVEMDIEKLKSMSKILLEPIVRERTKLNITGAGVIQEESSRYGTV
jgi:type III restriction enzyme